MKKRILIIDDEPAILYAMKRDLRVAMDEYEVYTSLKSEEAAQCIDKYAIDVLITDIYMPGKEGIELIAELHKKYPLLKIIAMSGGGRIGKTSCLEIAKMIGASYSLKKPFSREELLLAIKTVLM
ncbi:MAG: response regulator [Deltaproteobacteria bacterium]|nr:response regulator [Deltaproteobacteria bacterium]